MNKTLLIPFSPKKELRIPKYINKNKKFSARFIRGLFDTDGCTTTQKSGKYRYKLIKICTGLREFANEIKVLLESLNICCYICRKKEGYDITIRRKESYVIFFNLVKPKK